jgi:hypothetical protein
LARGVDGFVISNFLAAVLVFGFSSSIDSSISSTSSYSIGLVTWRFFLVEVVTDSSWSAKADATDVDAEVVVTAFFYKKKKHFKQAEDLKQIKK